MELPNYEFESKIDKLLQTPINDEFIKKVENLYTDNFEIGMYLIIHDYDYHGDKYNVSIERCIKCSSGKYCNIRDHIFTSCSIEFNLKNYSVDILLINRNNDIVVELEIRRGSDIKEIKNPEQIINYLPVTFMKSANKI